MTSSIFNNLPALVEQGTNICGQFFDKMCCTKFIHNLDFSDIECLKMTLAKGMGYGIVVFASIVKLPQVLKIFGAKSGAGLTLFGVLLELLAITFNAGYSFRNNFPISAWGEAIFLGLETAAIAFLILWYDGGKVKALSFLLVYPAIVLALIQPTLVSREIMWWLQSSVLPLAVIGKLFQAFKNFKAGHTGQISATSAFSIFVGSLARVFTTIQETGDMLTAVTFACSAAANAILASQIIYYWKATNKFIEKGKKKKTN